MGVAQHDYTITGHKGEGHWAMQMVFVNRAVAADMPDEIECSHEL
jgi:hypothetical protein